MPESHSESSSSSKNEGSSKPPSLQESAKKLMSRRKFLTLSGLLGAGSLVAAAAPVAGPRLFDQDRKRDEEPLNPLELIRSIPVVDRLERAAQERGAKGLIDVGLDLIQSTPPAGVTQIGISVTLEGKVGSYVREPLSTEGNLPNSSYVMMPYGEMDGTGRLNVDGVIDSVDTNAGGYFSNMNYYLRTYYKAPAQPSGAEELRSLDVSPELLGDDGAYTFVPYRRELIPFIQGSDLSEGNNLEKIPAVRKVVNDEILHPTNTQATVDFEKFPIFSTSGSGLDKFLEAILAGYPASVQKTDLSGRMFIYFEESGVKTIRFVLFGELNEQGESVKEVLIFDRYGVIKDWASFSKNNTFEWGATKREVRENSWRVFQDLAKLARFNNQKQSTN